MRWPLSSIFTFALSRLRVKSDCIFGLAGTFCVIGKPIDDIDVAVTVRGMRDMVHGQIVP